MPEKFLNEVIRSRLRTSLYNNILIINSAQVGTAREIENDLAIRFLRHSRELRRFSSVGSIQYSTGIVKSLLLDILFVVIYVIYIY